MKRSFILGILLGFYSSKISAQNKTFTLTLYYNINEVSSQTNFNQLDSLYTKLGANSSTISVYGYADFLNSDSYNIDLSQKRADEVKNYLLKKTGGSKISIKICKGLGEKNSKAKQSSEGEVSQRRVEVIIIEEPTFKKIGTRNNVIQDVPKKESPPEKKNLAELNKGESLAVEGLSFIPGRHLVTESSVPVMNKLLRTLKEHPELYIEIQGHVCCPGDGQSEGFDFDTNEYKLSENRAKAVYDFLITNGIEEDRLTYKGYGHRHPKVKIETTEEEEQINRRVEIKIIEN